MDVRSSARITGLSGAIVLLFALLFAGGARALESVRFVEEEDRPDDWSVSSSCSVSYANTCTGWIWVWNTPESHDGGWEHQSVIGMVLNPCCPQAVLHSTTTRAWTGAPSGYGFTGTLEIANASSEGCPTTILGQVSYLPVGGVNIQHIWDVSVDGPVVLSITLWAADIGYGPEQNPSGFPSDHPAAGPTGPQPQGLCYPSTRVTHSFYYGNPTSPLCPGRRLNDGVGDVEWLNWSGQFQCTTGVEAGVDAMSWGAIKTLYR